MKIAIFPGSNQLYIDHDTSISYIYRVKTQKRITYVILALYEVVRTFFILTAHPESTIDLLPASWFAAVPLLALPIILSFSAYPDSNERFYYLLAKAGSVAGCLTYCVKDIPYALNGALNNWYSLSLLTTIVCFSLIDAILFVILIIPRRKSQEGKDENADNSNSQR